jgi:hypothetical protein
MHKIKIINIFKMQQMTIINKLNNFNEIINSFSNDFNKQKNFIQNLNYLTNFIYFGNMQMTSSLEAINNILPYIMKKFGLPFCDLMSHYNNIFKYYISMYITNKTDIIKYILITFIKVFNFKSYTKTPADALIEVLKNYDNDFELIANEKRTEKNEIEEIYDTLNLPNLNEEKIKLLIKQINEVEKRNIYPISTIQYLKEKLDLIWGNSQKKNINNLIDSINNINNICNIIKSLQNFNYLFFVNNMQINNNNINNFRNGLNADEINKLKEIPLKDRVYLYSEEDLNDEEDEYTEFKNYTLPFSPEIIYELKRQYCGFLNSHGGRIYIGINDLRIVKGLYLDNTQIDTIRKELINYINDFYPECRTNKINVYFIPIKSKQTNQIINHLYVIKIIIMPGEPYHLYSLSNKGGFISTLRLPGQCINLTAEEIYTEIIKRGELLKRSDNNEENRKGDIKENIYEELNENINESENEETDEKSDNTNNKKKVIYVVKITNIDTSIKIKDINRFFNGCGSSEQKFPAKEGRSTGFGEIIFSKKETAKKLIEKYNRIKLCGTKQITMKLKKRIKPA